MALGSEHHGYNSFTAYQNLRGRLGTKQQQDILGAPSHKPFTFNETDLSHRLDNIATYAESNSPLRTVVGVVYGGSVTVNINYRSDTI